MSYFKKFTDFCAGVAAFAISLFFIRKYMAFDPPNVEEDAPSKLAQFLETGTKDYSMMIPLIFFLVLSIVIGRIFQRLPYVCLVFSVIPAMYVAYMFQNGLLYDQKVLLIILSALHIIGNLAECIFRDGEDGRHRLSISAKLTSAIGALFCLYTTKLADKPLPTDTKEKLPLFDNEVITEMNSVNMELITRLGWIFLALLIISLVLHNVYFIDAILSVVPLIYSIHACYSGQLTVAPAVFMTLAAICAAAHIMLAVFENNLSYKEQKERREALEKEKAA